MTKFIWSLIVFLPLLFISCSGDGGEDLTTEEKIEDNFEVKGTIVGAPGTAIYVEAISSQGTIPVADTKSDAQGNFTVKGNIPGMGIYQLRIGEAQDKAVPLVLVEKDVVTIKANFSEFPSATKISGVEWSAHFDQYMTLVNEFVAKQSKLMEQQGTMPQDQMQAEFMTYREPLEAFAKEAIEEKPSSTFNLLLVNMLYPAAGFDSWDKGHLTTLKKMLSAYQKTYADSPITEQLAEQVSQIEGSYSQYLSMKSGLAPEITLQSPEGKIIKLSSLKGNYVLIDFWASWCGPCRKENPNVVRLYNKYKDKGFTIYSVSLDTDANAWKTAIAADGLIWPNHVSDLLGWKTPMTSLYGFNSIPHTVLIDKEGKIVDRNLRGESLERKLQEIFKI